MTQSIVLGGGCLWCTEATFQTIKGVISVLPGYAGGHTKNPTYKSICTGETGHAEVIKVDFDEKIITLAEILRLFFRVHDPTQYHKQGQDVGSQYRSIILYSEPAQLSIIQEVITVTQESFEQPIVTEVDTLETFCPAEESHKDFYKKNPVHPYCMLVIRPKLDKLKRVDK